MRNLLLSWSILLSSLVLANANFLFANTFCPTVDRDSAIAISVTLSQDTYIKGKAVDILITVKNISERTAEFYPSSLRESLILIENGVESRNAVDYSPDAFLMMLKPGEEYYRYVFPTGLTNAFKKYTLETMRNAQLDEGNYKYRAGFYFNGHLLWSDYYYFRVLPVPDSLQMAYDEFIEERNNVRKYQGTSYNDEYLEVPKKLKYDYFEKEYLQYVLTYTYYSDALDRGSGAKLYKKASELVEKFILKYPNTSYSSERLLLLLTYRRSPGNLELFNRILTKMTSEVTDEVMANSYKRFMKENKGYILRLFPKFRKFCLEN